MKCCPLSFPLVWIYLAESSILFPNVTVCILIVHYKIHSNSCKWNFPPHWRDGDGDEQKHVTHAASSDVCYGCYAPLIRITYLHNKISKKKKTKKNFPSWEINTYNKHLGKIISRFQGCAFIIVSSYYYLTYLCHLQLIFMNQVLIFL